MKLLQRLTGTTNSSYAGILTCTVGRAVKTQGKQRRTNTNKNSKNGDVIQTVAQKLRSEANRGSGESLHPYRRCVTTEVIHLFSSSTSSFKPHLKCCYIMKLSLKAETVGSLVEINNNSCAFSMCSCSNCIATTTRKGLCPVEMLLTSMLAVCIHIIYIHTKKKKKWMESS